MKKFISLLVALLTFSATSVWADGTTTSKVTSVSTTATPANEIPIGGGYFLVKVATKGKTGYAYYNGNTAATAATSGALAVNINQSIQTDTIGNNGSLAYVWHVDRLDNALVIQNAGNGAFFPMQNGHGSNMNVAKNADNAAALYFSAPYNDKGVLLYQSAYKLGNNNIYVHCNDTGNRNIFSLNYWENFSDPGTASVALFTFYPVTLAEDTQTAYSQDVFPVKYTQKVNDKDEETTIRVATKGATATSPWTYSYYYTQTITPNTIDDTKNVVVSYTKNSSETLPFTFGQYYNLKVRDEDNVKGKFFVMADNNVASNKTSLTSLLPNDFVVTNILSTWTFEESGLGLKMRNANGKYITVTSPVSNNTTQQAQLTDKGTTFYLQKSDDYFTLQLEDNVYLGDHSTKTLGSWRYGTAATDGGSRFRVVDINIENLKTTLETRLNTLTQPATLDNNVLRVATEGQITQAKAALTTATTPIEIWNAYKLAFDVKPDKNAFYRIKGMGGYAAVYPSSEDIPVGTDGRLLSAWNADNNINRVIERKTANDKLVPQLWRFVDNGDGTYKIKNANNNCTWANATSNIDMPIAEQNGGNYRFLVLPTNSQTHEGNMFASNDGVSTFQLLLNNHTINAAEGHDGTKLGIYDNHDEDGGNYWQFEKVTEIPVTISAAKYTTVGFPFNTRVTTEGVKVFYAKKAENGWVSLTEVENKVIPANQGAILYNETGATTATLAITTDEVSNYEGNVLTATAAKRVGFATLSTYGLGVSKTSGDVCFMKNESTDVPANKAYLLASNYSEAQGGAQELRFAFDGNIVSGIENTLTPVDVKKGVFYDLNGRRVLYPTHGIFINANGQKVFLK